MATGYAHFTHDEDGNLCPEFVRGKRKLTLWFEPRGVSYLKSWGPDIETEMEDGEIAAASELGGLFEWLMGEGE